MLIWTTGSRRIRALVSGLNPDGALYRELNEYWYWGLREEFLGSIVELLDRIDRHFIMAHSKDGDDPGPSVTIPRPELERKRAGTTMREFHQMIMNGGES